MNENNFLQFILENILEYPNDIEIQSQDDELWTLISLKVHPDDMWLVIWKKWSTITALRSLIRLHGMKMGKKLTLKIIEDSSNTF